METRREEAVDANMDPLGNALSGNGAEDLGRLQDEEEGVRQLLDSLEQAGLAF